MKDFGKWLFLSALVASLAYCGEREQAGRFELQKTCIDAGRVWTNAWGGYCEGATK